MTGLVWNLKFVPLLHGRRDHFEFQNSCLILCLSIAERHLYNTVCAGIWLEYFWKTFILVWTGIWIRSVWNSKNLTPLLPGLAFCLSIAGSRCTIQFSTQGDQFEIVWVLVPKLNCVFVSLFVRNTINLNSLTMVLVDQISLKSDLFLLLDSERLICVQQYCSYWWRQCYK